MSAIGYAEQAMLKCLIAELLEHGFALSVNDGEEEVVKQSRDPEKIFQACRSTDQDLLIVFHLEPRGLRQIGWIKLVYGNDGWDLLSDYTINLEPFLVKTQTLSNTIEAA